jgi:hypothetical protein
LNKGVLTRTQLSRALSRINLRMTDTEIDTLADAYAAQGQVCHTRFLIASLT